MHDKKCFLGKNADQLSNEQRRAALRDISVIKYKRCWKIKGQTTSDGRGQRNLFTKDETSSPIVSRDALMMSITIDAVEYLNA